MVPSTRMDRWIGGAVAALTLVVGWIVMHHVSVLVIAMAVILGIVATLVARSLHREEPPTESPSPDETLW